MPRTTSGSRGDTKLLLLGRDDPKIPAYARKYEELRGICLGGCIRYGWEKNWPGVPWPRRKVGPQAAHAHPVGDREFFGWICSPYRFILTNKRLLLHEIAHLIVEDDKGSVGHSKRWKEAVIEIGGSLEEVRLTRGRVLAGYRGGVRCPGL